MELDGRGFPGRWMELWVYDPEVLKQIGRHHMTGEPMPDGVKKAVVASETFSAGSTLLEELERAH
eukprot:3478694-Amphidinium_carterae.1